MSAAIYGTRRADDEAERKNNIKQGRYKQGSMGLLHQIVPRTDGGSVWTQSNVDAVLFTGGE